MHIVVLSLTHICQLSTRTHTCKYLTIRIKKYIHSPTKEGDADHIKQVLQLLGWPITAKKQR